MIVISLASMLGSGVFVLPAFAGAMMGEGIWLAYLLSALIVLPAALSKSELASAMPTSGGSYVYMERAFGAFIGTVAGLGLWSSFLLKSSFALIGFQAYLSVAAHYFHVEMDAVFISMSFLVVIVGLNILGVKKVKAVQVPITVAIVVVMLALCGVAFIQSDADLMRPLKATAFSGGFIGVAETAAFVFVAYLGVTNVAAIAGEVKSPGKNLPRGMLISLLISTLLYVLVGFALMVALPGQWWLDSEGKVVKDSIYHLALAVGGETYGANLGLGVSILAILTMASMALAGLMAASRFGFAMARDSLLPQSLENVNARFETPHWAIIITGVGMAIAILCLPVSDIAKLISGFKIMIFCSECLIVIVLRRTVKKTADGEGWYKPLYHSPLYPFTQWAGIFGCIFLLYMMGQVAVWGALAVSVLGVIIFFGYGRYHAGSRQTPFELFRKQLLDPTHDEYELEIVPVRQFRELMRNPTKAEHERRVAAFHAADAGGHNHLTLGEFQRAMHVLGYDYYDFQLREIFHAADENGDGWLIIDEFLAQFEEEFISNVPSEDDHGQNI